MFYMYPYRVSGLFLKQSEQAAVDSSGSVYVSTPYGILATQLSITFHVTNPSQTFLFGNIEVRACSVPGRITLVNSFTLLK